MACAGPNLDEDGTNVNGAIVTSDGGWSALYGERHQTQMDDGGKSRRRPLGSSVHTRPAACLRAGGLE